MAGLKPPPGFEDVSAGPLAPPQGFEPVAPELSWSDVPGQAWRNAPKSALEFGKAIVQPILHPIETAGAIADIGKGVASKVAGAVGVEQDPKEKEQAEAAANAVAQFFVQRYGSMDALKKTLATDPVGAAADAATVLTGGGAAAARAPGVVGRVGKAAQTAGSAIDPIANAGRAVGAGARGVSAVVPPVLGLTTGAGPRPIQEAYKAGKAGNQVFTEHMRGARPINEVVDMASDAVESMGRDRGAAYQAGIASTKASQQMVHLGPVMRSLRDAYNSLTYQSAGKVFPKNDEAIKALKNVADVVDEFKSMAPGIGRSPEALDALKQRIGGVLEKTEQGTTAHRVVSQIYNDVKTLIVKEVPEYAKTMDDYSKASESIREMRGTLSLKDKASTDTTVRKLQSTMRNNVNANFGARGKLLDELAQYQPDLPPALAGQALNTLMPRGLAGSAAGLGTLYQSFTTPSALAALPAASPRVVGEMSYAAGRGANLAGKASAATGATADDVQRALLWLYATGQLDRSSDPRNSQ